MAHTVIFTDKGTGLIAKLAYYEIPTKEELKQSHNVVPANDNQLFNYAKPATDTDEARAALLAKRKLAVCYQFNGTSCVRVVGGKYLVSEAELDYLRTSYRGVYDISGENIEHDDEIIAALSKDKAAAQKEANEKAQALAHTTNMLESERAKADRAVAEKAAVTDELARIKAELDALKKDSKKGK
jgi:hypothetical protein